MAQIRTRDQTNSAKGKAQALKKAGKVPSPPWGYPLATALERRIWKAFTSANPDLDEAGLMAVRRAVDWEVLLQAGTRRLAEMGAEVFVTGSEAAEYRRNVEALARTQTALLKANGIGSTLTQAAQSGAKARARQQAELEQDAPTSMPYAHLLGGKPRVVK